MKFERDKQLHFLAGSAVGAVCWALGYPTLAFLFAALVGAFKELYDAYTPGRVVDFWDFVWTAIPGALISGWSIL